MRYHSRKYFSRSSHTNYSKRTLIWNSSFHYFRSRIFTGFFWAFYHSSLTSTPELGRCWPPTGIRPLNLLEVPLLNTSVLLASGVSIVLSPWQPHRRKWKAQLFFFFYHNHPDIYLTPLQASEYYKTSFTISDGVYGLTFFIATWFHGLHVFIGSNLVACLCQLKFHFTSNHFDFEAADTVIS